MCFYLVLALSLLLCVHELLLVGRDMGMWVWHVTSFFLSARMTYGRKTGLGRAVREFPRSNAMEVETHACSYRGVLFERLSALPFIDMYLIDKPPKKRSLTLPSTESITVCMVH